MTRADLRLELLKLSYTHSRDAVEAVGRAKVLENFVLETEEKSESVGVEVQATAAEGNLATPLATQLPVSRKASGSRKHDGNPDILS